MVESTTTLGTSAALTFTFSTQAMRVVTVDGEPWFCAADVCDVLGYANSRDALSKHCRAGGVAKRDTPTSSGVQPLTFINEGNLYRLCIKSHKPEAQKFEAWVCDEVLPAIRKTGRYVAPNAPQATTTPTHVNERLTGADIQNIKHMIRHASHGFQFESSWNQAIWFYLRMMLDLPSPHPFGVDHLPLLAIELHRINAISDQVHEVIREIETQAAKRIFRKGESADVVVADLRRLATQSMAEIKDDIAKLPSWLSKDMAAITNRTDPGYHDHLAESEKPGYFDKAQGAAA